MALSVSFWQNLREPNSQVQVYANASCLECLPHEINTEDKNNGYVVFKMNINGSEHVFVNLLRSPGIDFQPGRIDSSESWAP
jgi:hypothetical protein